MHLQVVTRVWVDPDLRPASGPNVFNGEREEPDYLVIRQNSADIEQF
jgi:hypothetical protein